MERESGSEDFFGTQGGTDFFDDPSGEDMVRLRVFAELFP